MDSVIEKFTVEMTEGGLSIFDSAGSRLDFSAGEALMLLDILRNEEPLLNKMAEEASPLLLKINRL